MSAWVAEMAMPENGLTRTACLAATAETLLTSIKGALQPDERTQQGKTIATVHEALGELAFQSAWEAGQRLTIFLTKTIAAQQAHYVSSQLAMKV
jgi:hypothetical protein